MKKKLLAKISAFLCAVSLIATVALPAGAFDYGSLASRLTIGDYSVTTVAPDANHISLRASDENGLQNINAIEFDPKNPYTVLRAGRSAGYVYSVQTVKTMADNMSDKNGGDVAVAAINGDFFTFGVGVPHGVFIDEGRILSTPPQYYAAFGLTYDDEPFIVRHGTILDKIFRIDGVLCDVTGINNAHAKDAPSLMLYTSDYARGTKTGTEAYELRCRVLSGDVRHGDTIRFVVEEVFDAVGNTTLGEGYIVLSAQGARIEDLKRLNIGDELEMSFRFNEFWSNVKFAVGGIELLLKDGAIYSEADKSRQPRTSIGIRADGTVVMATFDGRQDVAAGMSYKSAAEAMMALGCVDALNLDGGGSTTFVLRNPGEMNTTVVNKVSGSSPRQVANALVLMNTAPTGTARGLTVSPATRLVMQGGSYAFSVTGAYDKNIKPTPVPTDIFWSTDSLFNTIDDNGVLTAAASGTVSVTAASSSAQGTANVEIVDNVDTIIPDIKSISASAGETVEIKMRASLSGKEVECPQELYTFTAPEALGTFTAPGKFTLASEYATGNITVSLGTASVDIPVEMIFPPVTMSDFEDDAAKFVPVSVGTKVAPNWKFETNEDLVRFGSRSLKVYYNFLNTTESVGSYYMVANDSADDSAFRLNTAPKKLGIMAYGDGSGIALRTIIEDANGVQYTLSYTGAEGIDWTGWKYVETTLPESLTGPIYVKVPVYLVSNPEKLTHGCLYFDRLRAVYSEVTGEDFVSPEISKAWPDKDMIISTRTPSVGVILRDDTATETDAGLDAESIELWINGYNCTDRAYDAATGKISYTVKNALKNGKHTILVRARDKSGNPIIREWKFEVRA